MSQKKATARIDQVLSHTTPPAAPLQVRITALLSENLTDEAARLALTAFLKQPRYTPNATQSSVLSSAQKSQLVVENLPITRYIWNPNSTSTVLLTHGFGTSAAFVTPII